MNIEQFFATLKADVSSFDPYLNMARNPQNTGGQFRVKWLRIFLVCVWFLAFVPCALLFLSEISGIIVLSLEPFLKEQQKDWIYFAAQSYGISFLVTNLFLDGWTLAALFYLANIWIDREKGERKKQKILLIVLAVSIVLGRPFAFFLSFLFAIIPNSWWFLWPVKFGLFPPLVLMIDGLGVLLSLYLSFAAFLLGLVVIPLKIYRAVLDLSNSYMIAQAEGTVFFGTLVHFWFWFTGTPLPEREEVADDSKGARFAIGKEIEALRTQDQNCMAFGHVNKTPLFLPNEKHVLIMASTRSGKGTSLLIPHLLRYRGSVFVLDPKGENAKATGRHRSSFGKVHYLDPFGITGKPQSRFNPLARFTPENMEAESKALACALVMGENGKRDHWTGSAQQLLAAVILHVVNSPSVLPEEKHLGTVRRLLLERINSVLREMLDSEAADGLLARLAASFLQTPEKEFGSILSTAQRETEILDNPFILESLAASGDKPEIDFKEWRAGTMSVFLCLSAPKFPVFNRWLRLVVTSALDEMTDTLDPPALPVCFLLDELATLGHMQPIENAVGLSAGYGLQLVSVFQDVAQMRDLYKGRWSSFIGNAGVRAVFALDDYDSAKYWSQFIGSRLYETKSKQQDVYGMEKGQSKGETMRPLLSPEQVMMYFSKGVMLVLTQGSRPLVSERVPYYEDASLAGVWDDPRSERVILEEKAKKIEAAKKAALKGSLPRVSVPPKAAASPAQQEGKIVLYSFDESMEILRQSQKEKKK